VEVHSPEKITLTRNFVICILLAIDYWDYQIKEDEMGWAYSTHGTLSGYKILAGKPERRRPL
jgi:hypothetical protein